MALEQELKEELREDILYDEPRISPDELEKVVTYEFSRILENTEKINMILEKKGFHLFDVKEESYNENNDTRYYNLFIRCDEPYAVDLLRRIFSTYEQSYDSATRILMVKAISNKSHLFLAFEGITTRMFNKYRPLLTMSRSGVKRKSNRRRRNNSCTKRHKRCKK